MTRGPQPMKPCGTFAAYTRHLRRHEKPCTDCRKANARRTADRARNRVESPPRGDYHAHFFDFREMRNDLPDTPGYRWRARRYPWAVAVLERSEATYGRPDEEEAA